MVHFGQFLVDCARYRPAVRYPEAIDTSTNHVGFRVIVRPPGNSNVYSKADSGQQYT